MGNQTQFNRADGAGYRFLADIILRVDGSIPQLAARLMTAFSSWRMMESGPPQPRPSKLRERLPKRPDFPRDASDIVHRTLQ